MRLLLDTHIFLWFVTDHKLLSKKIRQKILNADEVYVSSASIWEAAIKIKIKKLEANLEELVEAITESGFLHLPISSYHASSVKDLTEHHKDPFDRMLVAQSQSEALIFLTADTQLKHYSKLVEVIDL